MNKPRLRIFAGPNGSGKTSLFDSFATKFPTGYFLNADNIEKELSQKGFIDLNEYNLNLKQEDLIEFKETVHAKTLLAKANENNHPIDIEIKENIIVDKSKETHSYEGALIGMFLRYHLMALKSDFCFETVMSHASKIEELKSAKEKGYKTYLYFICIDDPEINISRVENRVEKGGHNVEKHKIESRYYETLKNLYPAIEVCDKCYLFDNSQENQFRLISSIDENKNLKIEIEPNELPNWFKDYVLRNYLKQ